MTSAPDSALDALLAIEHEVASRLANAEREAEAMIAAARVESERAAVEAQHALDTELAALDAERRAKRAALVATLEANAAARTGKWRAMDGDAVTAVAARLAERVIMGTA